MLKIRREILAFVLGTSMLLAFPGNIALADPETEQDTLQKETSAEETSGETPDQAQSEAVIEIEDIGDSIEDSPQAQGEEVLPEFEQVVEGSQIENYVDERLETREVQEIELEPGQDKPQVDTGSAGTAADTTGVYGSHIRGLNLLQIDPQELKQSFRFETVDKDYAVAKKKIRIYTEMDVRSKRAGRLAADGLCYILEESGRWCYVESGDVRGFVKTKNLITGEKAREIVFKKQPVNMKTAVAMLESYENPAFTFTKTTVQETVVNKLPAFAMNDELNVREGKSTDDRIVGVIPQGGVCYILADRREEWCYVESGDVRGFVLRELLTTDEEADKIFEETKAEDLQYAKEEIAPEENDALYYTLASTEEAGAHKGRYLGKFKVTAYCACPVCCGIYSNGVTASGTVPVQGKTIAMYGVPFGTQLVVGDKIYTVEDRGTPYGHIDIYMVNHEDAEAFGVKQADVYLAE